MNFYLTGFKYDLEIEIKNLSLYLDEYKQINNIFQFDENKYDRILLEYGTEKLKIANSLLTTLLLDINNRAIEHIFDLLEAEKEYDLGIFLANRVFEKYNGDILEHFLIRKETYVRALNFLLYKNDIYFFTDYLVKFLKDMYRFLNRFGYLSKEIYLLATYFNQFIFSFYITVIDDYEKAVGYIIKDIEIRDILFKKRILKFPENNNIINIINLTGLYLSLKDSIIKPTIDIDFYIKKLKNELVELSKYLEKEPEKKDLLLNDHLKRYLNEFLTNIYISGFENYYIEISEIFPEILTRDHKLTIRIINLYKEEYINEMEIENLRSDIDISFNNLSSEKKERVLYLFYNFLVEKYAGDEKKLNKLKEEIERKKEKFYILKIPLFRILNFLGYKKEAYETAEEVKKELTIYGKENLLKAVERYLEENI